MKGLWAVGCVVLALMASGCSKDDTASMPPPNNVTADATGYYCGMLLAEHGGPKGQILLAGGGKPIWFTSVRDTFVFLDLPEEPKDVAAVYVSDMGKAPDWDHPGEANWIAAENAVYVTGSDRQGGMGGAEAVPFGEEIAARAYIAEHGGQIVKFDAAKAAMAKAGKN